MIMAERLKLTCILKELFVKLKKIDGTNMFLELFLRLLSTFEF